MKTYFCYERRARTGATYSFHEKNNLFRELDQEKQDEKSLLL